MAKSKAKSKDQDDDDTPKRLEQVKRDGAYLMMLFITLVAIGAGCVLLYLDKEEYGGKAAPKEAVPTVRALGAPLAPEPGAPVPAPVPPAGGAMP